MYKLITLSVLLYTTACLLLYWKQRDLLFLPTSEAFVETAEAQWIDTGGAQIKLWKINSGEDAILYFGGNAEPVEHNIDLFDTLFAPLSVYLTNYRGYGGSSGYPNEAALINDALAIYDALAPRHRKIHVIGRSLGSGVAVQLAAERPIDKLVLITPFDSVASVARRHYPIFPVSWLLKDRFDSIAYASSLSNSVLVLSAGQDRIIPAAHTSNLINALSKAQVETLVQKSATHNDILSFKPAQEKIASFLSTQK